MFAIPTKNECVSIVEFYQSEQADFAIWVLVQYGLEISPFDKHRGRMKKSSAEKPDKAAWQQWFQRIVVSQYAGLCLRKDRATYLAKQQERLAYAPFVHNGTMGFNLTPEEGSEMVLENYRNVVYRLSTLSDEFSEYEPLSDKENPVSLWEGSQTVKSELEKLWRYYRAAPNCRIHHESDFYRHIIKNRINTLAVDLNNELRQILRGQEKFLMFHLVNYSSDVFTIVGPSIVIGLERSRPFSPDAFKAQVVAATRAFIRST